MSVTCVDDRPEHLARRTTSFLDGIDAFVDRMLVDVTPESAVPVVAALFAEVTGIYRHVLDECRGVTPAQQARVRAAGAAFARAGGSTDGAAGMLGRLASHLITLVAAQRPERVVALVDVAHVLVREFLSGAAEPPAKTELTKAERWSIVRQLVLGEVSPADVDGVPDGGYVVAVLQFAERVPQDRLMALIEEHGDEGVLTSPIDGGAVALVPERAGGLLPRLLGECEERLGSVPWLATASCAHTEIPSGYRQARDVLALAVAVGQEPGRCHLDDVLLEFAIVRDPVVCRRLMSVIEQLLTHDVLRETLESLIRTDFNRVATARDLFVHRSTLDYRIRRIEEITGHNPMTSRGAGILRAAMTAYALAKTAKW